MGFTREPPAWQGRPGQNHRFHNVSQIQPHHISGVQAKKNIHLATYHSNFQPQQLLPQHHPSLVPTHSYAPSFCNTMTSFDYHTPYPVITHMQAPNGARYFPSPSRPRPPNYDGTLDSVQMSVSPPNPGSELGSEGYYSPSSLQEQQQQPVYPIFLPGPSASNSTYLVPSFQQPHLPMSQQMLDFPSQGNPYYFVPINGSEMPRENGYSGHEDNTGVYRAETNGSFHGDSYIDTNGTSYPYVTVTYPAQVNTVPYVRSIHNAGHQPVLKNNLPTSGSRDVVEQHIQKLCDAAKRFTASFCPHLGKVPYCLPPINRSRHPDKSSKQLVLGVESEKRVLGSFERYFAEYQVPVFMLCHYPISGFLHNFNKDVLHSSRDSKSGSFKSSRDTVTLLLLSDRFSITIVMVSVISGNSDFAYIQRGVQKAASHMKRCSLAVSQWLTYLRLSPEVKEVIAFPNLKKAMMQRITKDKQFHQSFGNLCTLHVDDLSAPFEEEWSTPVHKHLFSEWMRNKVLCHPPTLKSIDDLRLVVGAMLSPELSNFEHVQGFSSISPIPDTVTYTDTSQETPEDVSQLKLTIDGVTKPFDDFMDEYVKCYYPEVDTKTYRVPPIHFNIQSFKKPSEVETVRERAESETDNESCKADLPTLSCQEAQWDALSRRDNVWHEQFSAGPSEDRMFMASVKSYKWIAFKDSNCAEDAGPADREGVMYDDDITDYEQWRSARADSSVAIKNVSNIPTSSFSVSKYSNSKSSSKGRNKEKNNNAQGLRSSSQNQTSAAIMQPSQNPKSKSFVTSARSSANFVNPTTSIATSAGVQTKGKSSQQATNSDRATGSKSGSSSRDNSVCNDEDKSGAANMKALQDVEILSEVMTKDIRADEGENRVISAFEMLGRIYGPMFIICGYQYNNYLNKLREEMFSKGEANRPIRAFGQTMRAEHDCLIFHKKFGAIVVCIKAIGDNFSDWGASEEQKINSTNKILEKAIKQLEREEAMIQHVTSDLKHKVACHKLIALPNMTRESVKKALQSDDELMKKVNSLTAGYGADLFLCQDELPTKYRSIWDPPEPGMRQRLNAWWELTQDKLMSKDKEMGSQTYRQIIGRYCGLLSTVEVWSPSNPRMEVRSMSEAVSLCAERYCKLVLLPHQVNVLASNHKRLFLYGPPGCGKTLLLLLKAREWLLAGEKVIIVNARPGSRDGFPYAYGVSNRLKHMMAQQKFQNYKLILLNVDSLKFKADDLANVMPCCCVIMDEVTPATHSIIEHLCCLHVKYIWCAGLFEEDRPITAHKFVTKKMDKILRCPPIVQSLLKHTEQDVRLKMPYQKAYQGSLLEKPMINMQRHLSSSSDSGKDSDKENFSDIANKKNASKAVKDAKAKEKDKAVVISDSGKLKVEDNTETRNEGSVVESDSAEAKSKQDDEGTGSLEMKYDADSLNKRLLAKYGPKNQSQTETGESHLRKMRFDYSTSSVEIGLPTDGPRPHIIDHRTHSQPGNPLDCSQCGKKLAEFLQSMVKLEGTPVSYSRDQQQRNVPSKNKFAFKNTNTGGNRNRVGKASDSTMFSNSSTIHTKSAAHTSSQRLETLFDSRALTWSDVLIVAKHVRKDCALVSSLRAKNIPLEVVGSGPTYIIETSKEKKLFITSYKEVTGLERALIVFIPQTSPDQLHQSDNTSDLPDLQLGQSISRFTEEDRTALWYVASRTLSSLVLILP